MALGLTVVSTNAGGLPYLIDNGKDGFLVEKENSSEMARKIDNIIFLNVFFMLLIVLLQNFLFLAKFFLETIFNICKN